uniref:DM13 domain-containing protein n=1 Tax=Plectus sambesii TaxID=2011161 RepID=A0A914X4C2_9BILA
MDRHFLLVALAAVVCAAVAAPSAPNTKAFPLYLGQMVDVEGQGLRGDVYATSPTQLYIRNFVFNGNAPAPHFYIDDHNLPSGQGVVIPSAKYGTNKLGPYNNEAVYLTLPQGQITDYHSFSVYCTLFKVTLGYIQFNVQM